MRRPLWRQCRYFAVCLTVLLGGAGALAYFTATGAGAASASIGTLSTPSQPVIAYTNGTATVEVKWTGSTLSNGAAAQGYYVTRNNGSTTSPACGTSPTSLTTSTSCTDSSVPDGTYTYKVIAVWNSFSATGSASESVTVVLGGGALANPTWTTSKSLAGATGATYTYSFTTATGAALTSVTMSVPSGTAGTPALGTVTGIPGGGTVSLASNTLTYTFASKWVNAGTAASIQITGLTNTPNVNSYTSQISTKAAAVAIDNGITAAVAFTGGTLSSPIWTTSKSLAGATGATYTYSFTTATASALSSVTMSVPPGTGGTPAAGTVSGVAAGGSVSLSNNTLTYTFAKTEIAASTAVSIQITGLTNTSNVSSYTSQITTYSATVPIDNGATAAVAFTGGTLSSPIWTTSKSLAGATGATYTYSFKTATAAEIKSVTMTVPPGTAGSPAVSTVSGLGAGTVSLSENTLTYTVSSPAWVNSATAVSIQITGLTNASTPGSYTSQIATDGSNVSGPSVPLDSGTSAAVAFTGGTLSNPIWTSSKSLTGASGAAYTYSFTTATAASLTSVTMTVPPGTAGTPVLGTVKGVPGGGTVSLESNTLTYTFAKTEIAASTAVSIQITGLTNTATAGSYSSQITTNAGVAPIDNASSAALAFTAGTLTNPIWTTSNSGLGATGATYTYSFKTATAAEIKSVTMTVPPGTAGSPAVSTVSGLGAGTVSLSENTLTYTVSSPAWVNSATAVSIQITGLTNTSTIGGYTSQITTNGSAVSGPSIPLDSATTSTAVFGDTTPPSGSISYTNGYNNTGTVAVTFSATDKGSGVNTASGQLKRAAAVYTEATATCGTFGSFANVGPEGVSSPYNDSTVATGTCYKYEYVVPDNYGLQATIASESIVKVDRTGPSVSVIASEAGATGEIRNGATLTLTFSEPLNPTSIAAGCPSSCTITGAQETRTGKENVFLKIPGITTTAGADTGSSKYLSGTATATATFTVTVAFSSSNSVLTLTVSELGGATPGEGKGRLKLTPASSITDVAGNAATGTFETGNTFKLF